MLHTIFIQKYIKVSVSKSGRFWARTLPNIGIRRRKKKAYSANEECCDIDNLIKSKPS